MCERVPAAATSRGAFAANPPAPRAHLLPSVVRQARTSIETAATQGDRIPRTGRLSLPRFRGQVDDVLCFRTCQANS